MSHFAEAGRLAAQRLWREGQAAAIDDPLEPEFAAAAVAEFASLQEAHTPGILRDAIEGAQMSAEQLSIDPFQGVVEVIQNADDAGAARVKLALRNETGGRYLLFVHDGEPVRLTNLVAMALAFVSTKREDAGAKGRFGIGLQTLRALGDTLTVHCAPYHASVAGNQLVAAAPQRAIEGFYDPGRETLLRLRVRPGFDQPAFRAWLDSWDATSLMFLDRVHSLALHQLKPRRIVQEIALEEPPTRTRPLTVGRHTLDCAAATLRDPATGRSWRRYAIDRPVPPSAPKRRHKATGTVTPVAIAVPDEPTGEGGRLFAGLPLEGTRLGAPVSASAQFNVDTARTGLQRDEWNAWLLDRVIELLVAVAQQRFDRQPASGWAAVPLASELESITDRWLRAKLVEGAEAVQRRVFRALAFETPRGSRPAKELVYETPELERVVLPDDLARLYPELTPVTRALRDRAGRWRAVLGATGLGREVDADDALHLLDEDDGGQERPVSWYIRFARAVIASGEGAGLQVRPSVVLADGTRIAPRLPGGAADVLVRCAQPDSLGARLGLVRVLHPAYLTESPEAAAVRRWLEAGGMLVDDVGVEPTLRALARRGSQPESPPIELVDDDLKLLRDALATLDEPEQHRLGPQIGDAILVRGFRWENGKRVRTVVAPARAYVPATLEDRPDGWGKAAGKCPGIPWIEAAYADVLKRDPADRKKPGALTFFRLLGAEVAPRLIEPPRFDYRRDDPASPIAFPRLTSSQQEALNGHRATHLKRERLSPDLARVIGEISKERSRQHRCERGRALLLTLEREWKDVYQGHEQATAVYSDRAWRRSTSLPATWLAVAMDTAWLTTEAGAAARPRDLCVRTPSTEALYGRDGTDFAADVTREEASLAAVRALGLKTDPRVSEIVNQLAQLQASGDAVDPTQLAVRYAALASAVSNVDMPLDGRVGDITLRQLRARFGGDRRRPGLILADGQWLPPSRLLRGKGVFGGRRSFVPSRSLADRLWRVLAIPEPSLSDCIAVLTEIATGTPTDADTQVLLDTYVYMAGRIEAATRNERRAIAGLPLWSGDKWLTSRPVYAVEDPEVGRALAAKLPVWSPPVTLRSLGPLVDALDVLRFGDEDFTPAVSAAERVAGEAVSDTFAAAVDHLQDWLARHDPDLYRGLERWEELADATLALAPDLQLELRLAGRRAPIRAPARAHLQRTPLQLSFADVEDIAADDAGGRAVAALFTSGDRDKVALAWAAAWSRARSGERSARRRIAQEQTNEDSMASLFEQAAIKAKRRPAAKPNQRPSANGRASTAKSQAAPPPAPVRQLKSREDLVVASVTRPDGGDPVRQPRRRRGLKQETPAGKPIAFSGRPAPRWAPISYAPLQQEELALTALHLAINGELSDLTDFRHLRGVGADAFDRYKRAFEIKSFATAMPDQVTLTANEFERALKEGSNYHLAVVAGLEEGYETVVRIIDDPVHMLAVQKSTSIVLGGVLSATRPIEVRFDFSPPAEAPTNTPTLATT